jgi:hypothetical protein
MFELHEVFLGVLLQVWLLILPRFWFKHIVQILQSVNETVVVFVSQDFVVEHLITDFIRQCEAVRVLATKISHAVSVISTRSWPRRAADATFGLSFTFEELPVGSLAVDRDELLIVDARHSKLWTIKLRSVPQALSLASRVQGRCRQYLGRPQLSSFWMNSQNPLLYRYWHDFESPHYFQHLGCLLFPSLSFLIRILNLLFWLFLLVWLLKILFLIYLAEAVETIKDLALYGVLLLGLLCSFLAYLASFSFHGALKLIWALLTALSVFDGISLKENVLYQLFSLVHDIDELSKYLSEFFQFCHFVLKEPLWEQNSSSVLFGLF